MKKITILLAAVIALGLTACTSKGSADSATTATDSTATVVDTAAATIDSTATVK